MSSPLKVSPSITSCIQIMQLMPIKNNSNNINRISSIIYDDDNLLNEFLQKVDTRTEISTEDPKGKFIKSEQNRYGDSYRSPLSNEYYPKINDGYFPSENLRKLEEKLNKMFKLYAKNYYNENTIISVYCWEFGKKISDGFGVGILIKNIIENEKGIKNGIWDSSNIISVEFSGEKGKLKAKYNLVTSLMLNLTFENKICGKINLSGNLVRNARSVENVNVYVNDDSHIENIGVLVEDLETSIRNSLEVIYVMKTKEIIDSCRKNQEIQKFGMKQFNLKDMMMKK